MSFCQRLAIANCFVDWFIICSAQLIKLLPNLWWKISFKWVIYIVYAEIITKAFFRFCVLKLLLSHWHIFLITLRIPYSINDLWDSYINGAWLPLIWNLCDSLSYFFNSTWQFSGKSATLHHLKFLVWYFIPIHFYFKSLNALTELRTHSFGKLSACYVLAM